MKLQHKIYVIQHTLRQALRLELVLTWGVMSMCCLFYVQSHEFANVMLKALQSFKMSLTLIKWQRITSQTASIFSNSAFTSRHALYNKPVTYPTTWLAHVDFLSSWFPVADVFLPLKSHCSKTNELLLDSYYQLLMINFPWKIIFWVSINY